MATVVIPVNVSCHLARRTYEFKAIDADGRPGVTQITVSPRTVDFDPLKRAGPALRDRQWHGLAGGLTAPVTYNASV